MDKETITLTQIGWLALAFFLTFPIIPLATEVRKRVWICRAFDRENKGKIITIYKNIIELLDENWGWIVLFEILTMFIYITAVFTTILGTSFLMQSVIFAAAIVIFMTFQLPHLLKPNVHISLLPWDKVTINKKTESIDEPLNEISLPNKSIETFTIYVVNLGINNYEKLGCWVSFSKELHQIARDELVKAYKSLGKPVDKEKLPLYQKSNNALRFEPDEKLSMAAGDIKSYIIIVKTPLAEGKYPITIEINSSSRWGNNKKRLWLNIVKGVT